MGVDSELSVDHFRGLLKQEALTLADYCLKWRNILKSSTDIPEAIEGDIMVAIGQAELLMKERFSQFAGLIDDCEFKRGEKEIEYLDLQGFWDIIYFQVKDVIRKFNGLEKTKSNGWKEIKCSPLTNLVPKKKIAPCKAISIKPKTDGAAVSSSSIRSHILAARKKMLALKIKSEEESVKDSEGLDLDKGSNAIQNLKSERNSSKNALNACNMSDEDETKTENLLQNPETAVFDAGFFKVETPAKTNIVEKQFTPGKSEQKVLASTVLKERIHDSPIIHKDYSPCIRVTRSMKSKTVRSRKLDL